MIYVLAGRDPKHYPSLISLFVCLSTKVKHLEVVTDLTSEAFIAAFKLLSHIKVFLLKPLIMVPVFNM